MPTKKMTTQDAEKFVEETLLYKQVEKMMLITPSTIHEWVAMKARNIRDIVNAVLDGADIPTDEVIEKAINYRKADSNADKF